MRCFAECPDHTKKIKIHLYVWSVLNIFFLKPYSCYVQRTCIYISFWTYKSSTFIVWKKSTSDILQNTFFCVPGKKEIHIRWILKYSLFHCTYSKMWWGACSIVLLFCSNFTWTCFPEVLYCEASSFAFLQNSGCVWLLLPVLWALHMQLPSHRGILSCLMPFTFWIMDFVQCAMWLVF